MIDPNGLLMIEPQGHVSAEPLVDELTRKMAAALNAARPSDVAYRGFHMCACGATSGNRNLFVTLNDAEVMTNSLAVHYLAYHRQSVPQAELDKVAALEYGEAEPTTAQLSQPTRFDPRTSTNRGVWDKF